MTAELNLRFPENNQVIVRFGDEETDNLPFESPLTEQFYKEIRWYFEVYSSHYTTKEDDETANNIAKKFSNIGEALFDEVFKDSSAQRLLNAFQEVEKQRQLVTISSELSSILSIPWELLKNPQDDTFLLHRNHRISIRRKYAGTYCEYSKHRSIQVKTKDKLTMLFVVSRPQDAGFLDPRSDTQAILDILENHTKGRIEAEFLRPATRNELVARLERIGKYANNPVVDIVHFDGHGVYKPQESLGYLLFTSDSPRRIKHLVSAQDLGKTFRSANISLLILSACQSATVGEDPMGSVAVQLSHEGVPSVIAMTYSVHINTTRFLFEVFYKYLSMNYGIGLALDNARKELYTNPERIEVQRGRNSTVLKLHDWFLPAFYQEGEDNALLTNIGSETPAAICRSNLPQLQKAGFFGRSFELWKIECAFVYGTRRVTITGFGGQGKTYLAQEAGRWLYRTGMFEKVCFVSYSGFHYINAVELAIKTLATVLDKSLQNVKSANKALNETPVLLILDNLESLKQKSLQELLNVAKQWSETGECRVLITTRTPNLHNPDYSKDRHEYLYLDGLTEKDALGYFQSLVKSTPAPEVELPKEYELLDLFRKIDFHPLSITLLTNQLKVEMPNKLGERLETLLFEKKTDNFLIASLNLSLEKLDREVTKFLPKLGVFQGGAWQPVILAITELSENQWQYLRTELENIALIHTEHENLTIPYFRFHPTLAPALWLRLSDKEKQTLLDRHCESYYELSNHLYFADDENPHVIRTVALSELPNLLFAVNNALDSKQKYSVNFVEYVNKFLYFLGFNRDKEVLTEKIKKITEQKGSQAWYFAKFNLAEQLFQIGKYNEAEYLFKEILVGLEKNPSYERCYIFDWLGQCLRHQGKSKKAEECYRQGIQDADKLEQNQDVKRQIGVLQTGLGAVLTDMENYEEAKKAYKFALIIAKEQNNDHQQALIQGHVGTIALKQGNLQKALELYNEAKYYFQRLNEPKMEAVTWHQIGVLYCLDKQWDLSEQAYRNSAKIREDLGSIAGVNGAAVTWGNLASVMQLSGRPDEAEAWYRKAIEALKNSGDITNALEMMKNLAHLIKANYPDRKQEVHEIVEYILAKKLNRHHNTEEYKKTLRPIFSLKSSVVLILILFLLYWVFVK